MPKKEQPFRPAEILLPKEGISPETWACVACDQYTSQPEYWEKAEQLVGSRASTLRLMLPECYLKESDSRIPRIHGAMADYLESGVLVPAVKNGYVLCERKTASGTRVGLVGAEGVHVGQGDMPTAQVRALVGPDLIVGTSATTVEEAVAAERAGADYLGVGAMYATPTKDDAKLVTFDTLREICATVSIPVVVIGGINGENVTDFAHTGIAGISVVSAIFGASDIGAATGELLRRVDATPFEIF